MTLADSFGVEQAALTPQQLHDQLLPLLDRTQHPSDCPFCAVANEESLVAESQDDTIETLRGQVADLQAQLAAQESADKVEALEADITALKAEIDDLQSKLDTADAAKVAAEAKLTDVVAFLEAEHTAAIEAAARDDRKAERVAAVTELAVLSDARIEESADRWADMDDDAFAAVLADYQEIRKVNASVEAPADPAGDPAEPSNTALGATAPVTATDESEDIASDRLAVMHNRHTVQRIA